MTIGKMARQCVYICIGLLIAEAGNSQSQHSSPLSFKKTTISNDFISEGVGVGDVNKDGLTDVLAGTYWFEAPDWKRHEISPGKIYQPRSEYSRAFLNHAMDVNLDGWTDLIMVGYPGTPSYWYENPKNGTGYWQEHMIFEAVGNESPGFVDVDGDGRIDLLCADSKEKQMIWLQAPTVKGETEWKRYPISKKNGQSTDRYSHGLGLGDINKDGRSDVIIKTGWWEAPANPKQPDWTFHPADLGEDCSQLHVLDVNRDGVPDVISASAHNYGIWWHQLIKNGKEPSEWEHHVISSSISQTHSSELADFNNDGYPDLVTGKRYFAHLDGPAPDNKTTGDPGTYEKSLIVWFEYTPKAPYWIEHEIDDDSGVGLNFVVQDMNKDGLIDIVVSNKKGVFVFENLMKKK